MAFQLPELPYDFAALEPNIDAKTMEIHHGKHHAGYVANLNNAVAGTALEGKKIEEILASVSHHSAAVRNNGGGHYNHSLFWSILAPAGTSDFDEKLNIYKAITRDFGSLDEFKAQFKAAATGQFGSGWAWLCVDKNDKLFICGTPNQDNPLMDVNSFEGTPVLGIDVWEHAYYLNYQNRRPDYVDAFFHVINWQAVSKRYNDANQGASSF
ncbi:MAG: superoxide dismutase [Saprospiraceae bacterium]|nr:superoxide dismutase [Saprospiraceae bacterium]